MNGYSGRLRQVLAVGAVVALGAVASACGGDSSDEAPVMTIVITGADQYPVQALLTVADQKGWFDEEGVEVDILSGGGGGDTVRVATTGSADVAMASATTVIPVSEAGDLKIIGPWFQTNDFVWLTPDDTTLGELDRAELGITSSGSSSEMMIEGFKKKFPDTRIEAVVAGSPGEQWAAAKSGHLDGAVSLPPYSNQLIAEEGAHVLASGSETLGDLPVNLVAVKPDYAKEHPENLKAFWRVADRAMTYARESPAEAARDLAKIIKLDAKYIKEGLVEGKVGYDIKVNPEVLANLSDLMLRAGAIDEPLDWNALMDQSFMPAAARART